MLFLVYMPLEPQSGRCSQSTSNIYHQHKNLHKMLLWQSRRLKSNVSKDSNPHLLSNWLQLRCYLWGVQSREEQGLWSLVSLLTRPPVYFIAKSLLLNTEAKSQGFMSLLCFLSSSLPSSLPYCALHSVQCQFHHYSFNGRFTVMTVTVPSCWHQHWICLIS